MILGKDDTSMMTVRKQKTTREEVHFPWKEKRAGQSWRAGSGGPYPNVLVDTRAHHTGNERLVPVLLKLHDFYAESNAHGKPMYTPGASERNEASQSLHKN